MNWRIVGILVTLASAGLSLVADKVNEEKMKKHIQEEVEAQLSERKRNEEES